MPVVSVGWAKKAAIEAYLTVCGRKARAIRAADRRGEPRCVPRSDREHVQAAAQWICRAQDTGSDDGVSAMFSLVEGWVPSYPETTGYIIPTLFDASAWLEDETLRTRAARMADWLLTQQFPDGAFPGLFVGSAGPARVFNTGQIIFGLVRASRETGQFKYVRAAAAAGEWLLASQDPDGCWRRNTLHGVPHTYNTRTAWAMLQLGAATGDERFRQAAMANADWALTQQCDSDWFRSNDFVGNSSSATLHTIAYAMRGLLEIGSSTRTERYVEAARRTARALYRIWDRKRCMAGRYRADWSSPATWRCLPGEAQLTLVWLRLDQVTGEKEFRGAAEALLEQVKAAQFMDADEPDLCGGLSGSLPLDGDYERWCLVNWGTKFLIDALILKGRTDGAHPTG